MSAAVADGRLTPAELDERAEAALKARTRGELAALTADLQTSPAGAAQITAQAKDLIRLDCQGEVDADDMTLRSGRVRVRPQNGWKEPARLRVEVSGENHAGHVGVRPPRRTFRQWLLRRPRLYAASFRD